MKYVIIETRKLINQTTFYQQHISPTFGKFYQLRFDPYERLPWFIFEGTYFILLKIVKKLTKSTTLVVTSNCC